MKEFAWLKGLMEYQTEFERSVKDKNGQTLEDYNTPEYILMRGIIGEAREALEALTHGSLDEARAESIDILVFLSSLFNHLNMTPEEVERLGRETVRKTTQKYHPDYFKDSTIEEGIKKARRKWIDGKR